MSRSRSSRDSRSYHTDSDGTSLGGWRGGKQGRGDAFFKRGSAQQGRGHAPPRAPGTGGRGGGFPFGQGAGSRDQSLLFLKEVAVNHFNVKWEMDAIKIYKHLVVIELPSDPGYVCKEDHKLMILEMYLRANKVEDVTMYPYDGDKILLSKSELKFPRKEVTYRKLTFQVEVVPQSSLTIGQKSLSSYTAEHSQILNIIALWALRINYLRKGKSTFVHENPSRDHLEPLTKPGLHGIYVWRGHRQQSAYVSEVQLGNYNASNDNPFQKVLRSAVNVVIRPAGVPAVTRQRLSDYFMEMHRIPILGNCSGMDHAKLAKMKLNLAIETCHVVDRETGAPQKRTYKMDSLVFDKNASNHFIDVNGQKRSLVQYFREQYGYEIKFPRAPLVLVKPVKRETMLPAELVFVSLQKIPTGENETLKSAMAESQTMEPGSLKKYTESTVTEAFSKNPILEHFGVTVTKKMCVWKSDVLVVPSLRYKNSLEKPAGGTWNLSNKQFLYPAKSDTYAILNWAGLDKRIIQEFHVSFKEFAEKLGIKGDFKQIYYETRDTKLDKIRDNIKGLKVKPQILVVIFKFRDTVCYREVKNTFTGVITTTCLVAEKTPVLNPRKRSNPASHFGNVWSKINQRLLGRTHKIDNNPDSVLTRLTGSDNGFMVMSVSMSHPESPVSVNKYAPSFAAIVCSLDNDCTVFLHSIRAQVRGSIVICSFDKMLAEVLVFRESKFKKPWPKRIVILREGVAESQKDDVFAKELVLVNQCYSSHGKAPPKTTAFIINRTHGSKFFNPDEKGPQKNLGPGTVILENGITAGAFPNFYLLSHVGTLGTSKPAHYTILKDELSQPMNITLKGWAQFCYDLCFLYARCQRVISCPAPLMYARKLAERGRDICHAALYKEFQLTSEEILQQDKKALPESVVKTFSVVNERLKDLTAREFPMFY